MASRGDEVEHGVNTIVSEAGVTLDTRLLSKNVIVLPLEVADDLGEAARNSVSGEPSSSKISCQSYLASLSIWSPKPGVSTMVREMRVPSSSNSSSVGC